MSSWMTLLVVPAPGGRVTLGHRRQLFGGGARSSSTQHVAGQCVRSEVFFTVVANDPVEMKVSDVLTFHPHATGEQLGKVAQLAPEKVDRLGACDRVV